MRKETFLFFLGVLTPVAAFVAPQRHALSTTHRIQHSILWQQQSNASVTAIDGFATSSQILEPPPAQQLPQEEQLPPTALSSTNATATNAPLKNHPESLSFRSVLKFVTPTLALWMAPPVMSLIDTAVVGRYCGPIELAALSPACTLIDSAAYLCVFLATACTNLVATALAQSSSDDNTNDNVVVQETIQTALTCATVCGTFLALLVWCAGRPLLHAMAGRASATTVPAALAYSRVRAVAQPFALWASIGRATSLATQDTAGPLLSVALAFGLNLVGTLTLVRVAHWGIVGAAAATVAADVAASVFLLRRLQRRWFVRPTKDDDAVEKPKHQHQDKPGWFQSRWSSVRNDPIWRMMFVTPPAAQVRAFLRYAFPIFCTILGKSVVYNGVGLAVGRLGATALAAHQVLQRNFFFWTPVGDSVGMTSQVFLPGILLRQQEAAAAAASDPNSANSATTKGGAKRLLFGVGVLAGACAATVAGLLPSRGAGLFTRSASVTAALRQTAPILAMSVGMHAIALTCEGMLLAQRDLDFLSRSYIITTVITISGLLSSFRPSTLNGSWWILACFQGGRAFQFATRTWLLSRRQEATNQPQSGGTA